MEGSKEQSQNTSGMACETELPMRETSIEEGGIEEREAETS